MAKEIAGYLKLQVRGGQANPSPPVGPALGAKGLNIMEFCKQFNGRTQDKMGQVLPVLVTIFSDKCIYCGVCHENGSRYSKKHGVESDWYSTLGKLKICTNGKIDKKAKRSF